MAERTHYKILQVDPAADLDVITAAYRTLAGKLHPDRDATGVAEFRMKELNQAYAVLRDPEQRQAYDESLARERTHLPMGPGFRGGGSLAERVGPRDSEGLSEIRLDFGRYQGWTLGELLRADPTYLRWLSRHSSGIRYRTPIMKLLAQHDAQRSPLRTGG